MANCFYLDASALAKRYVPEKGFGHINTILENVPGRRIYLLNIGISEVLSILVRKRNAGVISSREFEEIAASFDADIIRDADINKLSITSRLVTASLPLIVAHSLNSTDALILKSALAIARKLRRAGNLLVLVASDQRLLRAAQTEGLVTFDPETQDHDVLAALVSA